MKELIEPILRLHWGYGEIVTQLRQEDAKYIVSTLLFQYGGGTYRQEFEDDLQDEINRNLGFGKFYRDFNTALERSSYFLSTLIKEGFVVQKDKLSPYPMICLMTFFMGQRCPRNFTSNSLKVIKSCFYLSLLT